MPSLVRRSCLMLPSLKMVLTGMLTVCTVRKEVIVVELLDPRSRGQRVKVVAILNLKRFSPSLWTCPYPPTLSYEQSLILCFCLSCSPCGSPCLTPENNPPKSFSRSLSWEVSYG